ncbi:ATP-binding cassette domain-containing protein [Fructobacillus sp. M1-13]|uniref:ATP-binding cassette domain-containing protein n=1 Tax=Fructobacillus papyriferae TaxID=2713171 RepID=A0ABS5QQL5_9LACO|nr:ABC transporter ATP-binding protein/permease [Fructobacillus papyriferae]MBS9335469.1 ATP-binding cassette domain-containing protein [Fructobacillus papyriferae]MCD2159239.1 ATP-binding cassette domain-containing protein [Fructobacillus papyriferae]
MSFLELKNIHKSYHLGSQTFPVLKGINLAFDLGDFVSILGESGGGKSTLMNIIGGLDRNFDGSVTIKGKALNHKNEKALDTYRRETIGYIYQSYNLISHLTVLDNVLVSLDMTTLSKKARVLRAKELLARVGLAGQIKKYPNQLSGGQKQRVAIARALASDPKVIIADEPTGALDSENTKEVLRLLNEIASEGRLVITVTHSEAVANAGTRIVRLADGKIESDKRIRQAYDRQDKEHLSSRPLRRLASIKTAFKHFRHNLGTNSLIIFGTAIGLFSVILFSGLGNGVSHYISSQITKVANPQVMSVSRYVKDSDDDNALSMSTDDTPALSTNQLDQLKKQKHVAKVEPTYSIPSATVSYQNQTVKMRYASNWTAASTADAIKIGHAPKKAGEVVIDQDAIAKKLDKEHYQDLIGKQIQLAYQTNKPSGETVTVSLTATISGIGHSDSKGAQVNAVNTETLQKAMQQAGLSTDPTEASVKVDTLDHVEEVASSIDKVKDGHNRLYKTSTIQSLIKQLQTYVNIATFVLSMVAAISLIVSALMIIVTMFMSVSKRTKEIGILRALGESKRDIRWLFIAESLITGVLSATVATVIAYLAQRGINGVLRNLADYTFVQITFRNVITAFFLAIMISLLAALLPARRAAKLNPIDALSAE